MKRLLASLLRQAYGNIVHKTRTKRLKVNDPKNSNSDLLFNHCFLCCFIPVCNGLFVAFSWRSISKTCYKFGISIQLLLPILGKRIWFSKLWLEIQGLYAWLLNHLVFDHNNLPNRKEKKVKLLLTEKHYKEYYFWETCKPPAAQYR
jgi:hypothetical protein